MLITLLLTCDKLTGDIHTATYLGAAYTARRAGLSAPSPASNSSVDFGALALYFYQVHEGWVDDVDKTSVFTLAPADPHVGHASGERVSYVSRVTKWQTRQGWTDGIVTQGRLTGTIARVTFAMLK